MNIYFTDAEHRQNYAALQAKFPHNDFTKNSEYRSACYLAALPGIFKCIDLKATEHGPFDFYFDYLEDPDTYIERRERGETRGDTAPLTGQTREMVRFGISLWNGGECDLSAVMDLDPNLYLVMLQAIDLRRRRPSFDYSVYEVQTIDDWDQRITRKMDE